MKRVPASLAVLLLHQEADASGNERLRVGAATLRKWVQRRHITRGDGGYDLAEILTYLEQRERSTSVDDLITWLRAQLDDDERLARAVEPLGYTTDLGGNRLDEHFIHGRMQYASEDGMPRRDTRDPAAAAHFAAHDPARVLREVEAKRLLLDEHREDGGKCDVCADPPVYEATWRPYPCRTVRLLALPYADRPGYLEEWRAS